MTLTLQILLLVYVAGFALRFRYLADLPYAHANLWRAVKHDLLALVQSLGWPVILFPRTPPPSPKDPHQEHHHDR